MINPDDTLLCIISSVAENRGFDPWDFDVKAFRADLKKAGATPDEFISIMKKHVRAAEAAHKAAA
jgi:hypothetical protein